MHLTNMCKNDEKYMWRCLQLARNGMNNAKPNPMVGAVIVHNDRIIGEGYHIRCGEAHAEVNAFASVNSKDEHLLHESTIYVSLEPCSHYGKTPPCAELIIKKGVKRVVVGCVDPFAKVKGRGIEMIRNTGIEVTTGVLEKECEELNKRFFTFHREQRPYIILKWAQTSNGFIDNNFKPLAISTEYTKMLSHKMRAEEDAILVGRTTDEREHPLLTVREWHGSNPKRIVLSHDLPLEKLVNDLYCQDVQSLIVEGGAITHTSFIKAGLWDEIRVETAPIVADNGTKAPALPEGIVLHSHITTDGNTISTYRKAR